MEGMCFLRGADSWSVMARQTECWLTFATVYLSANLHPHTAHKQTHAHRQYAGTGALKSGFTRTGKRTLAGLMDDGVKSITRYYLNNFKVGGGVLCVVVCVWGRVEVRVPCFHWLCSQIMRLTTGLLHAAAFS